MDTIYGFDPNRGHIVWLDPNKRIECSLCGDEWMIQEVTSYTAQEYMGNYRSILNPYGRR